MEYTPVRKSGRSWNGAHRDAGIVVHAIIGIESNGYWGGKALCGTEPRLRSNGWTKATTFHSRDNIQPSEITCEKCIKKINNNKSK